MLFRTDFQTSTAKYLPEGKNTAILVDLIELGRCIGPYGLKGGVRLQSYTRPPSNILSHKKFLLKKDDLEQPLSLLRGNARGHKLIVYFDGIVDRCRADDLSGGLIYVGRNSLPSSDEKHYYWTDLIGFKVLNTKGEILGTVAGFIETGGHDVLRVSNTRERLIPFVMGIYIVQVTLESRIILADWHVDD